ncbi:hypothetical protein GBA52_013716 [Prunus armeniaca]|nr:hypothetical protein GBA52_013716 [Prunus armeniaca]
MASALTNSSSRSKVLIKEVKVTPAEVAGDFMKSRDAQTSLQGLINFLLEKKTQQDYEPKTNTICTKEEHLQEGGGGEEQELM